jgi:Na+-transporting methylmalonyl-CoA/oxaloacetate decarboxylase gamma subunit
MFGQTVLISVWGMGLTFLALGLVVLSMVVLTSLARQREQPEQEPVQVEGAADVEVVENFQLAAVAAVALAKAQAAQRKAINVQRAPSGGTASSWESYTRAQKLDKRRTHQVLRW